MQRRDFLQFLGVSGIALTLTPQLLAEATKNKKILLGIAPSLEDKLITAEGLSYKILLRWGDKINATQKFGFNCDFIAYHALGKDNGILWVNHEYIHSLFIKGRERSKENVDAERLEVGGSLIEIKKVGSDWQVIKDSKYNRRVDGTTKIPFAWSDKIYGQDFATGTIANCAGGQTPWGTILTCEENYDMVYGERDRKTGKITPSFERWEDVYPHPPEHYGWVVEVNPLDGKAKKLISLGRCAHECAAVTKAKNGNVVAYTGDDSVNEHIYKFISDSDSSLERGKLYVANLEKGEWVSLDINDQPVLKKTFKSQTDIQIYAREAAKLVGATPMDRPEDFEFDPLTGHVLVALTNNKTKGNFYGSILKIMEEGNDPGSLKFKHEAFLTGGKEAGFACPDNMAFDKIGNLWFTNDISGDKVNQGPYEGLGNNALYVFLRSGPSAGQVIQIASAPVDAEFTGPRFSPDYKTLFLSVQHPGELTQSLDKLTSTWPDGGIPKSCVVTMQGPLLDKIMEGKL